MIHVTDELELYSLGALAPGDAARVTAHLSECPACREQARAIDEVVQELPETLPGREAPGRLRDRILEDLHVAVGVRLAAVLRADAPEGLDTDWGPGGQSRWSAGKDMTWVSLEPSLVCEVSFDRMQYGRFRHAATFVRWRDDRTPRSCTFDQLGESAPDWG